MKKSLLFLPVLLLMPLCPAGNGQSPPVALADDPFIAAVEAMKHSVAPLACLTLKGEDSTSLSRMGSAFFVTARGDFLTAAHVLAEMQKRERQCPVAAIILPKQGYQPKTLNEPAGWFPFQINSCMVNRVLDVAECRSIADLTKLLPDARITPVQFDWSIPPDGTQVAFTGFPFDSRDPMTLRAGVAAYRPIWRNEKAIDEVALDRGAWPGFSGSPVFRADGRVVGIVIKGLLDDRAQMAFFRPIAEIRLMLPRRPE